MPSKTVWKKAIDTKNHFQALSGKVFLVQK